MKKIMVWIVTPIVIALIIYSFCSGNLFLGIISIGALILLGLYKFWQEKSHTVTNSMPNIDVIREGDSIQVYGQLNGKEDREKAKQLLDDLIKQSPQEGYRFEFNKASRMMLDEDFEGSIPAFERLIEKYPEFKGRCIEEIGIAEFYLGNYVKALERYIEAKECGEDNEATEYNIWEVCEILSKEKEDKTFIEKYISLYPKGKYIEEAQKLTH